MTAGRDRRYDDPMDMAPVERLLPRRAQPIVAVVVAASLLASALWYVAAGGLSGGLVDHDRPPRIGVRFTVDLNAAGPAELGQLPGVGPAIAQRIVDHRMAHGRFTSPEDLLDVVGIGAVMLERIRPHLRPFTAPPDAAR
jgi:competence ComEA-like helix-hairpin-helix protein